MKLGIFAALAMALVVSSAFAQIKPATSRPFAADRDQLGMTCAQILAMSSSDWVAQFNQKMSDASPEQAKTVRAITLYGKCYDARTDRLAAALGRKGCRPADKRARVPPIEPALQNFTAKALAANDPPVNALKSAYATLYEKRFRYEFYEAYENRVAKPAVAKTVTGKSSAAKPAEAKSPASATPNDAAAPKAETASAGNSQQTAAPPDPMTAAKNRFGELLDALPDDKMHALHSIRRYRQPRRDERRNGTCRLSLCDFLAGPENAEPFSPPPF